MADTTVNTICSQPCGYQNPYFGQTGMAHDFFGSQIFGSSNYIPQGQKQDVSFLQNPPENVAQAVLHQFCAANGVNRSGAPTAQDYYTASQIASMFSANNPLPMQNTSFVDRDFFAQSLFTK